MQRWTERSPALSPPYSELYVTKKWAAYLAASPTMVGNHSHNQVWVRGKLYLGVKLGLGVSETDMPFNYECRWPTTSTCTFFTGYSKFVSFAQLLQQPDSTFKISRGIALQPHDHNRHDASVRTASLGYCANLYLCYAASTRTSPFGKPEPRVNSTLSQQRIHVRPHCDLRGCRQVGNRDRSNRRWSLAFEKTRG